MERMGSLNGNEAALSIISVRLERDETASGQPITLDRAVVSYSLDGATVRSATFRWDRAGDDVDTADVPHPSALWDELHDAALEYLTAETAADRRRLAYVAYVRATQWEDRRDSRVRQPLDVDVIDGGPTREIPNETLAEVARSYYAAQAVSL